MVLTNEMYHSNCRIQLSASTVNVTCELSFSHSTPFRSYGTYSTGRSTYGTYG